MGSAAGMAMTALPGDTIVSYLDDWSIAAIAPSEANDIAIMADADSALASIKDGLNRLHVHSCGMECISVKCPKCLMQGHTGCHIYCSVQ